MKQNFNGNFDSLLRVLARRDIDLKNQILISTFDLKNKNEIQGSVRIFIFFFLLHFVFFHASKIKSRFYHFLKLHLIVSYILSKSEGNFLKF